MRWVGLREGSERKKGRWGVGERGAGQKELDAEGSCYT